jgi:hypothetical protein
LSLVSAGAASRQSGWERVAVFRDPYTPPLLRAFLWQLFLLYFFSMVGDLGESLQSCCFASVAFWLGTILILVRRPRNRTPGDLGYIRWALVPIVLVSNPIFIWVWKLKGLL